ncbi:MAG: bifunctional folylpolyglutamate synthase/dihydrofolate synthase [Bacteroidales bacterium]|nr:bifunctional folylpolyglutamate synthase/dihydrofolate synthase [Bacteroidales bacterium]
MNYSETVHYLFSSLPVFQHSGGTAYKPGLHTMRELDDFYGQPHRKYATIHIAGTNGKGSVAHMLAAILQGSGYTTGLFTSPHLTDFRERIRVNGEMITERETVDFVERSRAMWEKVQPSFFEATAAMAFDHFARRGADVAVIETGMGGRLDATNIITPALSVITNISMDHTQFLGNHPIAIATEKAGIIKPGVPVVIGESQPGAETVFENAARSMDCHIVFADRHASVSRIIPCGKGQKCYIRQNGRELPVPVTIDMGGDYQRRNIITTLIAVQAMRFHASIPLKGDRILPSLEHAAQTTGLRGRWQVLCDRPLTVCDAAHNSAGLAWAVEQIGRCARRRVHIVIGFVRDKDIAGMLALLPGTASYYFTRAAIPRAMDERELQQRAQEAGLRGECYPQVAQAMEAARSKAEDEDMIFIGGSIFVIAEALNNEA